MLLKQSIKGTSHQVDLADYGLLWDDIDRLSIREVVLVDHKFEQHNRCRIVRIIVVKSCYLIVVHVKVNERNSSSEIINHAAFGTGPSNVVSVESSLKCEDEEQFIVACREGPLHILKVPSDNVASASMVTAEVSNIFFKNGDISSLDSKNYRCHGFKKSKNESLWVFLQNGLLDEQIKFSKGKLTFLTQKTFSSLSKTIFDKSNKAVMFGVPSIKDNLEVYRILACSELKEKKNQDDSYSRVFIDLIKCDLKACKENGPILGEKMQFYLWICQLFGTLSNSDEMIRSWDSLADELYKDILCQHACQVLEMFRTSDPSLKSEIYDYNAISSLRTFYLNFFKGDKTVVENMKLENYIWNCNFCGTTGDNQNDSYTDCFYCVENNHRWPRCVLTLKICDYTNVFKCKWCESVALKFSILDHTNVYCSICKGPFT